VSNARSHLRRIERARNARSTRTKLEAQRFVAVVMQAPLARRVPFAVNVLAGGRRRTRAALCAAVAVVSFLVGLGLAALVGRAW